MRTDNGVYGRESGLSDYLDSISHQVIQLMLRARLSIPTVNQTICHAESRILKITEPSRIVISCVNKLFIIQAAVFIRFDLWWVTLGKVWLKK